MATQLLTRSSEAVKITGIPARQPGGIKNAQVATISHDNFSFGDFLEMVNPLNYIPVVSRVYQQATGNQSPVASISSLIGGAIFGGPLGFAMAGMSAVFEQATGKGVLGSVADAVMGEEKTQLDPMQLQVQQLERYQKIAYAHQPDYKLFLKA